MRSNPSRRRRSIVLPTPERQASGWSFQPESEVTSMSDPAANTAARPNSSPIVPGAAISASLTRWCGRSMPTSWGPIAAPFEAAVVTKRRRWNPGNDFGACACLPPRIPSSARGHAAGLSSALRQVRSSASAPPPHRTTKVRRGPRITPPSWVRFRSARDPP